MVFTSTVFLGVFLPLLLAVYFLANEKARPYVLLVFSILFYAWGEPSAVVVMLALMVLNYFLALGMSAAGERKWLSAALLSAGVCADLGALVAYKYIGFIVGNLLPAFSLLGVKVQVPQVALPIGISFYVFQIISYMVDVRRGTGDWRAVNSELPSAPCSARVFHIWIDHGVAPKGASFSYEILPGM